MRVSKIYLIICLAIVFTSCSSDDDSTPPVKSIDFINELFLAEQGEIKMALKDLFQGVKDLDADKLISYHHYGSKFTDFKDGGPRGNSETNEAGERGFVGAISDFEHDLNDLKINVFGDVAVVTFHADFRPIINGNELHIVEQATVIWVKVNGDWKITHEHFSPLIPN